MIFKTFARSELQKRLDTPKLRSTWGTPIRDPISFDWAQAFLDDLDTAKQKILKIQTAFSNAMNYTASLDSVREELSLIPVSLRYRKFRRRKYNAYKLTLATIIEVTDDQKRYFEIGSDDCPKSVFPTGTNLFPRDVKSGDTVWCHFPVHLALHNGFQIVRTWNQNDSIVDWLEVFLNLEDPEASIRVEELWDPEDTRYTLYFPTAIPTEGIDTSPQAGSTVEQIYNFIYKYAPVRTGTIQQHNDIERYKLFRTLKRLENDNRIEKMRHGVFIPKIQGLAKLVEHTLSPLKINVIQST